MNTLRQYKWVWLLILAFLLGQGASLLQAQVGVSPGRYRFGSTIAPSTNDGAALGTTALGWSDLHLATGGVINWANGEVTITETDANTLTLAGGQFIIPVGTESLPSLAGAGYTTTGLYWPGVSGSFGFVSSTTELIRVRADGLQVKSGYYVSWGTLGGAYTAIMVDEATGILQFGADAAVPIAYTVKGSDARAGTDTDAAGGNMTFAPGRPTGTGTPGKVIIAQSIKGAATGTAASPLMTVASFGASGGQYMMPELLADPSSVDMTADSEIAIYSKSDKFVIAYNNGGIMTFISIPLDGSTATWTHSTTAP